MVAVTLNPLRILAQENMLPTDDAMAKILMENYGVHSLQYAVIDQGAITDSKNYSALEDITNETMYGIGSISKVYVAAATMMLAQEGKIELDTPVYQYLSDFTMQAELSFDGVLSEGAPEDLSNFDGLYGTFGQTFEVRIQDGVLALNDMLGLIPRSSTTIMAMVALSVPIKTPGCVLKSKPMTPCI